MMEAAENRASRDRAVLGEGMSIVTLHRSEYPGGFRNPRPKAQMKTPLIAMSHPLCQDSAQVFLGPPENEGLENRWIS